jgi:hypothetical protein
VRRRCFMECLGGVSLFSTLLVAQPGIVGPVEGFTFDAPTRSLRAVSGLLGSATFGPILVDGLTSAFVAPHSTYAIAFREGRAGDAFFVTGLGSDSLGMAKLSIDTQPDGIAWSRDGSVAVLYFLSAGSIQLISGLPGAPAVGVSIDLTPLGGPLLAVAADSTGQNIAIGLGGDHGGVYMMDGNNNFIPVSAATKPVALVFSDDGTTLYALDVASRQLLEVNTADFASQSLDLSDLLDPIAVAAASNTTGLGLIYVAAGQDRVLRSYAASTQQIIATVPLGFQPTSIQVLGNNSFILAPRAAAADPLWTFRNVALPAVYFVPAVSAPIRPPIDRKEIR